MNKILANLLAIAAVLCPSISQSSQRYVGKPLTCGWFNRLGGLEYASAQSLVAAYTIGTHRAANEICFVTDRLHAGVSVSAAKELRDYAVALEKLSCDSAERKQKAMTAAISQAGMLRLQTACLKVPEADLLNMIDQLFSRRTKD